MILTNNVRSMWKLSRDFSGYTFKFFRKILLSFSKSFSTSLMCFELKLKGIEFGKDLCFYGMSKFNRYPESNIQIGDKCLFVSDKHFNLAGLKGKCTISTLRKNALIKIGNNCGLSGVVIGCAEKIIIGDNVLLGANTFITDFDWHNINPEKRQVPCEKTNPTIIGNNVWTSINVTILKGVHIGENSVIGANSVVVKNIPANVIAAGNPCKIVKELNNYN